MAVYCVANYRITDLEQMRRYREVVIPRLVNAGAEFLVVTDEAEASEGTAQPSLIVFKFETREDVLNWYNSPEYQAVKPLRTNATDNSWIVIADEFVMPSD